MIENKPINIIYSEKIHKYLFQYPGRKTIDIHQSYISDTILLGVRIFSFVYLSGVYLWTLYQMKSLLNNIIYLTMMGYFGTWLYFGLVLQDRFLNNNKKNQEISPRLKNYIQILYQMTICIQVPITLVFWTLLLKILLDNPHTSQQIALNSNLHAAPMIFLIIEAVFNTYSFPIVHLAPMLIFQVIYFIINFVYSIVVTPIYKPINYRDVWSYLIGVACILITLFVHYINRVIYQRCKKPKLQDRLSLSLTPFAQKSTQQISYKTLK